jgi:hypothetical protein
MLRSSRHPELASAGNALVSRLGGIWRGDHGMCRCPAHPDRKPSLSVRVGDHALLFKCFAGCDSRDVIHEILRIDGEALRVRDVGGRQGPGRSSDLLGRQRALRLWDQSRPLGGTPAEIYLRRRRLALLPGMLRFNARTPLGGGDGVDFRPAMIAALHDAGRFVAVQRTFFDRDDARRARDLVDARMTLGRPRAGAVMLGAATSVLGLAEGIETALSAMILFDVPVWATLGAERLHQVTIPDQVTRLMLFPDNDVAGEIAEAHARHAYDRPGRTIDSEYPPDPHKDWNDVLRLGGKGVGKWWRQGA